MAHMANTNYGKYSGFLGFVSCILYRLKKKQILDNICLIEKDVENSSKFQKYA